MAPRAKKSELEMPSLDIGKATPEQASRMMKILESLQADHLADGVQLLDDTTMVDLPKNSTGITSLDLAVGGGYPQGRVIEIYGPESGGKTTVCLHAIAEVHRAGGVCAFIDVEHAYDPTYGTRLGVDHSRMFFSQPDSGEKVWALVEKFSDTLTRGDLIVVDSVANMTPQTELDGDMGASHVGLLARLMSQGFRKVTAKLGASGVTLIFVNQIRSKIGVMFGSPETTTGGNALKFYASIRLDVRRIGALGEKDANDNPLGNVVRIKVVKNKVAPPFREAELHLYFGYGFPVAADIFNLGVAEGVIEKAGSWFNYKGTRLGQGALNAKNAIQATPGMLEEIKADILVKRVNAKG